MTVELFGGESPSARQTRPQRPLYDAMRRGFFGKCPHCGEGRLFRAFLKSVDKCPHCGEELHHHRADDLPAYLVIVIVGHIVIGSFMGVEAMTVWPGWLHLSIWVPITLILSLGLIQPVKGAVIGLQWALYMHGFGGNDETLETHPEL